MMRLVLKLRQPRVLLAIPAFWMFYLYQYEDSSVSDSEVFPLNKRPPTTAFDPATKMTAAASWVRFDDVPNTILSTSPEEHFQQLPPWMQEYLQWHTEMRAKYVDTDLVTHPNAPPLLVRYCRNFCGGLHDRLGQLEWDIYLAYQTKRVWLLWWEDPPIETYLIPNTVRQDFDSSATALPAVVGNINWTVPNPLRIELSKKDPSQLFFHQILKQEANVETPDWSDKIDQAIHRANNEWEHKMLKYKLTAHEMNHVLNAKLVAIGKPEISFETYSHLFGLLFQPNPRIQRLIQTVNGSTYNALHWRVRYPMGVPKDQHEILLRPSNSTGEHQKSQRGHQRDITTADTNGLLWEGASKEHAIRQALHALQCVHSSPAFSKLTNDDTDINNQPIQRRPLYIYADSMDLIRYLTKDLPKMALDTSSEQQQMGSLDRSVWNIIKDTKLVTSSFSIDTNITSAVYHLDQQRGHPVESYDSTFVDMFVASQAHCIAYGLGRFGLLAAKVSGTHCQMWYQQEVWNVRHGKDAAEFVTKCFAET